MGTKRVSLPVFLLDKFHFNQDSGELLQVLHGQLANLMRFESLFTSDYIDGFARLVGRLFQNARVRKLGIFH